ncbi:hypothetical protein [Sulfitobacter sp. AS59]|uniref:hypothetical protein n=1 Tax=Sulfitobacter sp. AS59 TaxID=3135784 RepID=UPI00317B90AE
MAHLLSRRVMRLGNTASTAGQTHGLIIDAVLNPPRLRSAAPRHSEGNLLNGAIYNHIATLLETASHFVMLFQVGGNDSHTALGGLIRRVGQLPKSVVASPTLDHGTELAYNNRFSFISDISV